MLSSFAAPAHLDVSAAPLMLNDKRTGAGKGKTLCLVTDSRHSVVPTAHQLAEWLSGDGWEVTLLDLSPANGRVSVPFASDGSADADQHYRYVQLKGAFAERHWFSPVQSLCVYHWLRQQTFDLALFQHGFGTAYFSCVARKLGLAFTSMPIVVMPDFPHTRWLEDNEFIPAQIRTDAEIEFFEREAVARADAVFVSEPDNLQWLQSARWQLPIAPHQIGVLQESGAQAWGQWLASVEQTEATSLKTASEISLSICVLARQATSLHALIDVLQDQTHREFELIVIDQSKSHPALETLRNDTADSFHKRGWRWLEDSASNVTDALNKAAEISKGTHILFLDDDDVPAADMVEIFIRSAQRTSAPILSSMTGWHTHNDNSMIATAQFPGRPQSKNDSFLVSWIPYGANLTTNLFLNILGENVVYKREVFLSLGGFNIRNDLFQTWGLMTRAALANHAIEVIPEVLIMNARNKMYYGLCNHKIYQSYLSVLQDVGATMHPSLRPALLTFAIGTMNTRKMNPGSIQDINNIPENKRRAIPAPFKTENDTDVPQIVLCASDAFIRPVAVTVASIFANTVAADVHIVSTFSTASKEKIQKLAKHFGRSVHIIDVTPEAMASLPSCNLWGMGSSSATYWRLLLPDFLPDLSKVIYLDSDVLVRRDVAELWQTDMEGKVLGAALESSFPVGGGIYADLRNAFGTDYFNAGILLIDLKKWKEESIGAKVLEWSKKMEGGQYKFGDQSPLNTAVKGRWRVISPTWNFSQWNPKKASPAGKQYGKMDNEQYRKLYENPAIVHYLGPIKPWDENGGAVDNKFCKEYHAYMKLVDVLCGFGTKTA